MRVAVLFSGGKDSAYAAMRAADAGHTLACLVTVEPPSPDSELLHYPCAGATALQAESMGVPRVLRRAGTDGTAGQRDAVASALSEAARAHGAAGAVHGGLRSGYQRREFGRACCAAGLEPIAPVWAAGGSGGVGDGGLPAQVSYLRRLLAAGVGFVVTAVSAGGLGAEWLGRAVDGDAVDELAALSRRHGLCVDFEGGEAETLATDCPLFSRPLEIVRSAARWDGCRGELDIIEARLGRRHARRSAHQPALGDKEDRQLVGRRQGARRGARP